jgi:hypothetical protein
MTDRVDLVGFENLRRFCLATGADFQVMKSRDPTQRYRFHTGGRIWTGLPPALRILRNGRFGNNLRQILHAVHVATSIGAKQLYIDEVNVGQFASPWAFEDLLLIPFPPSSTEPVLTGTFFYRNAFKRLFGKFDGARSLMVLLGVIAPMLDSRWGRGTNHAEDVLHIHIRSGDTFSTRSVHPNYVPPPLAYYLSAIRLFQMRYRSPKIVIVVEDLLNPCAEGLYRVLRYEGFDVAFFCNDFEHTVGELLTATHLVTSVGLFAAMIALASTHIRSIYAFHEITDRDTFAAKGTDVTLICDCFGAYIRRGTWRNSAEQIRQVLEYPAAALRYWKSPSAPIVRARHVLRNGMACPR